ncbi:MAG: (Fe-S)-binding protein, partial [Anaerolineales bacterium]
QASNGNEYEARKLTDGVLSDDFLWACSTCLACDQECPLFIEHIAPLVDMRRHLVIEGRVDSMLQDALANLARYGNSFGKSDRRRAAWTKGLEPAIKDARKEAVETLWFVGDYASYHTGLAEITRKTAQIYQLADLDFGLLYDGERNAGNDVRRAGEEGLFDMLREDNLEQLKEAQFERIVTTDPHSYNTLKNEYSGNGDSAWDILHHSQLLDEMIVRGRLNPRRKLDWKVTYQDPCYLGRYNGIYDAPRRVIHAAGCQLIEMPDHAENAACCGAGGGHIWMEEGQEETRPSERRIEEIASMPGVEALIVACPKDVVMFQDAVKTTGNENRIQVMELVDVIHAAL